jgi:hypothetical protein
MPVTGRTTGAYCLPPSRPPIHPSQLNYAHGADTSTIAVCKKHGVPVDCVARKVDSTDFGKFDYILAMDQSK